MDIENIVEKRLISESYISDETGCNYSGNAEFNLRFCDDIRLSADTEEKAEELRSKYIKSLASQISSDIKKELKLVASGECSIDDIENVIFIGDDYETLDKFMVDYDRKNINIYIEEIDNG